MEPHPCDICPTVQYMLGVIECCNDSISADRESAASSAFGRMHTVQGHRAVGLVR